MSDDPLVIYDRNKEQTTALRGLLAGRPSFLVCGGPSAKRLPLEQLQQRGIFSLAVNNMAAYFRPNAFTCSDPPLKFHNGIWADPCIMKIIPISKLTDRYRGDLRVKEGGRFKPYLINEKKQTSIDCPNVWGFARSAWWDYTDSFFTEPEATWGNNKGGVVRTSKPKVLCTMLLAIRLLRYLGSKTIFLVGVDFHMTAGEGYAFGQTRTENNANSNNRQYEVVNDGLCEMSKNGVFQRAGLEVYNCYRESSLRAFEYAPFDAAVTEALKHFPKSMDCEGWYEKNEGDGDDETGC